MAESKFPWDRLTLPTITAVCEDLGYEMPTDASKEDLVKYLKDVNENGIQEPKAAPTALSEADFESFIQQNFKEMRENTKMADEKARTDQNILVQQTKDFWTGNISVDPTLERFDSAPGKVSIIVKRDIWGDGEDEDPWLKVFRATIKSHDRQVLGTFCYRVVDLQQLKRGLNGYNMHELFNLSERGGQELESFGMALFTKLGRPDPAFYASGNGVFGPEIATASFALLCGDDPGEQERDFFYVKEDYRRRGVGTQALKELFKHKSLRNVQTLFVWPSVNAFPLQLRRTPVEEKAYTAITKFFAKAGFRHVGTGVNMAYMLHDDSHPSRLLSAADDTPMPYKPTPDMNAMLAAWQQGGPSPFL